MNSYCKSCHNLNTKESKSRAHGGNRYYHIKRRYGLTEADVKTIYEQQEGKCAVCGIEMQYDLDHLGRGKHQIHIDHDHQTGVVRGLLCFNCNNGLGCFKDDADRMMAAWIYLVQSKYPTEEMVG